MTKKTVTSALQNALVDLIDLSLVGKQAHWNLQGPNFRAVHLQLDEVVADVRLWSDDVAERLATIGTYPDGRAATVSSDSQVAEIQAGAISDDKVVQIFSEQLDAAADRISAVLPELEEDLPSQDLLIAVVTGLQKHAWMFRAQAG